MQPDKPVEVRIEGDIVQIIEGLGQAPERFLREALVLTALDQGRISIEEACALLGLSAVALANLRRSNSGTDQRRTA